MRSAVSVILSGTAPEQNMSYPDYTQMPVDHQSLLVVVRHIGGQLRTKQFNRAFERISRINQIKVFDLQNQSRHIWIRYLLGYPQENNERGDFQTHRKALGLITVGQCNSQDEFNELCRIHESLKVGYAFTLYDSRCILFGLNSDGSLYEESHSSDISPCVDVDEGFHPGKKNYSPRDSAISSTTVPDSLSGSGTSSAPSSMGAPKKSTSSDSLQNYLGTPNEENTFDSVSEDSSSESVSGTIQYARMEHDITGPVTGQTDKNSGEPRSLVAPTNFKARTLFYPTIEHSQSLETDIEEFIASLFWILESKRMDKVGLRKADRHLLMNSLCAPFEKKDFVGLDLESKNNNRRADGRLKKQLGDLSLQAGLLSEAISHYQSAADILKSVNDWLWLAGALEGVCSASVACLYPQLRRSPVLQRNSSLQGSELTKYKVAAIGTTNSLPPGLDPEQIGGGYKPMIKNCLAHGEILEKHREAVTHYGKYRQAGIIETEASIKAASVLIEQRQTLHEDDFLQNAVLLIASSFVHARWGMHGARRETSPSAVKNFFTPHISISPSFVKWSTFSKDSLRGELSTELIARIEGLCEEPLEGPVGTVVNCLESEKMEASTLILVCALLTNCQECVQNGTCAWVTPNEGDVPSCFSLPLPDGSFFNIIKTATSPFITCGGPPPTEPPEPLVNTTTVAPQPFVSTTTKPPVPVNKDGWTFLSIIGILSLVVTVICLCGCGYLCYRFRGWIRWYYNIWRENRRLVAEQRRQRYNRFVEEETPILRGHVDMTNSQMVLRIPTGNPVVLPPIIALPPPPPRDEEDQFEDAVEDAPILQDQPNAVSNQLYEEIELEVLPGETITRYGRLSRPPGGE